MPARAKTFDEYIASAPEQNRAVLEQLRKLIHGSAPGAEECITYGIGAFRLDGKTLVGIGAGANHCSLYPMNGHTVEALKDELKGFETSKGAIRFRLDRPIPADLVRKIVQIRIAENAARHE